MNKKNREEYMRRALAFRQPKWHLQSAIDAYKHIRAAIIAGRSQVFWRQHRESIRNGLLDYRGNVTVVDQVSMYPHNMMSNDYPHGTLVAGTWAEFQEARQRSGKQLIGFFECSIDMCNIAINTLPRRGESLDWEARGVIEFQSLSTLDIEHAVANGCRLVSAGRGVWLDGLIEGAKLFDALRPFKEAKNEEDYFLSTKDPRLNPARREIAKLLQNAASGKLLERLHLEKVVHCKNSKEAVAALREQDAELIGLLGFGGLVQHTISEQRAFLGQVRPVHLGVCVYAYSRRGLYEFCLKGNQPLACETDSAFLPEASFKQMMQRFPTILDKDEKGVKIYGAFEVEMEATRAVHVAKKNYFLFQGEKCKKLRGKGFKAHDCLVRDERAVFDAHGKLDSERAWHYYQDKSNSIANNVELFINELAETGAVRVLTCQLARSFKTSGAANAMRLYNRLMVKRVKATQLQA